MIFSDGLFKIRGRLKVYLGSFKNVLKTDRTFGQRCGAGGAGGGGGSVDDHCAVAGGESDRVFVGV